MASATNPAAPRHSAVVRVTHWLTVLAFLALLLTGVEILISHPRFYWGETGNVNIKPLFTNPDSLVQRQCPDRLQLLTPRPKRLEPLSPLSGRMVGPVHWRGLRPLEPLDRPLSQSHPATATRTDLERLPGRLRPIPPPSTHSSLGSPLLQRRPTHRLHGCHLRPLPTRHLDPAWPCRTPSTLPSPSPCAPSVAVNPRAPSTSSSPTRSSSSSSSTSPWSLWQASKPA